jgi:hypothetical protein
LTQGEPRKTQNKAQKSQTLQQSIPAQTNPSQAYPGRSYALRASFSIKLFLAANHDMLDSAYPSAKLLPGHAEGRKGAKALQGCAFKRQVSHAVQHDNTYAQEPAK